ncbi:MAG: transcriptional regulator [Actinomycetota bacterium]|nr:transcriptional regulator [Actinomycetota bacterium]
MAHVSEPDLLALHGLRLKGFAEAGVVATLLRKSEEEVVAALTQASASELALYRDGRMKGWGLTPVGRVENERLLAAELGGLPPVDGVPARSIVESVYARFLALNGTMLAVCTRWQVKDADAQVLNDDSDPDYDAAVIDELALLDQAVQPLLVELVSVLDRFGVYPEGLTHALERVRAGDRQWFTKPIMESYHTVWFELHEDLLATLGIDRASEGAH